MSARPTCLDDCSADNCHEFNFSGQLKECKVVDVYDGDTCKVCIAVGDQFYKFAVRMLGYNTHEIKQRKTDPNAAANKTLAVAARDYLRELILGRRVFLQCTEMDKYGRVLGRIYLDSSLSSESCVNDMMLKSGHGFVYTGVGDKFNGGVSGPMPSQ